MTITPRLITLNLGSQTVGLAEFRMQPHGGLVLLNYRLREIATEAGGEEMRRAQIAVVVRDLMNELHIKHGAVNYSLPAQSVFARFVKLPALEQEKLERIIAFEAQQNVPFPIDDVVWDYQLVAGGMDEETQVILVAIKVDLLDDITGGVEDAGLHTTTVDVAPMALYNAFRYNYPGVDDCSLLVDIGARTTNVLFVEPQRIFSRSLPIGGSGITAAIAREFGESFEAAETRKKRDGFVGLGGAYADPADHDIARVSKLARSTLTRLHAELMRSISHYRAQQRGSRPDRIFLCGGAAGMPYMREFFHEKFEIPIEFFNPLRNVAVSEAAASDVAHTAHLLGELVGLALRSVTVCPMELSLLPRSVVRRQELERRRPFFIAAAACVVLAMLVWSFYYTRAAQVTRDTAEMIQQKNASMQGAETQLDKIKKQITSLDNVATPLVTAINDRDFWPQILEDLNARLPESDIWITELGATSGGKLLGADEKRAGGAASAATPPTSSSGTKTAAPKSIDGIMVRGLYLFNPKQQEIVVDYLRNLASSPFFVVDPKIPERVIKSNSVPNETDWAFPYELQLTLRKPVKLP
jgi:type IV pilus assembly protein PilM